MARVIDQARHEVAAGFGEARYYAGLARNIFGRTFESGTDKMSLLTREAAGVVAVIVPVERSGHVASALGCASAGSWLHGGRQTSTSNAVGQRVGDEVLR